MPDRILFDANAAPRFFAALAQVLVTLWVGGMWVVGYVAAPTLFAMLDNSIVAGNIAGRLFTVIAWIGMGTAVYLLAFLAARQGRAVLRGAPFWVVAVMLVCVAVGYFGIQAEMTALKAGVGSMDVMESAARGRFRVLHGVSSSIYLAQSVLGLWLVVGWRRVLAR
ncbi:hypothetical protein AGMMS50256_35050 [Betaproteobacteria bacterium]|nr:hypothetical protein AGMMS50256_35050 [Betaproteobacteria bacterium]